MAKIYASKTDKISERELKHADLAKWAATQGMVLLENDGTLPISAKATPKIALYGAGARSTEKGGTGSGDVHTRYVVNIEQGFERYGFEVTTKDWIERYEADRIKKYEEYKAEIMSIVRKKNWPDWLVGMDNPFKAPRGVQITEEDVKKSDTDTAVYVISRNSGEGDDRRDVKGDYEIDDVEIEAMKFLGAHYKHVIVILNVAGAVDTKFWNEIDGLSALFHMSLAGTSSGDSLLEVLSGGVTPSGKLTMTWAENYKDYPSSATFSINDNNPFTQVYNEGIFVGYRYFDTFGVKTSYEFGYGKSYTDFSVNAVVDSVTPEAITVNAEVTNTGDRYSGSEVVQIYVSKPDGKLEKPYQELAAFAKTKELRCGEKQKLSITFPVDRLTSYDTETASYIIEAGDYFIRVGNSSRNTHIVGCIKVEKTVVTEKHRNLLTPVDKIDEISKAGVKPYTYASEEDEKKNAPVFAAPFEKIKCRETVYSAAPAEIPADHGEFIKIDDVMSGKKSLDEFIGQLTVHEMANLCVGNGHNMDGGGATSTIGAASSMVPGGAGDTSSLLIDDRNVADLALCDGPAGLRLITEFKTDKDDNILPGQTEFGPVTDHTEPDPEGTKHYYQYCTAIPSGTLLAQSWDYNVIYKMGELVGREMNEFGASVWLAPAMNIMRNPLCGRNFEYYSEDPVVAAFAASADNDGVQSHPGIGTSIKHFAANNEEIERSYSNSVVSERALREIYLKNFELTVKASQPMTIMTSYNLINGTHTANNKDLITYIARDEWGFAGTVMTDWGTTHDGTLWLREAGVDPAEYYSESVLKIKNERSIPALCVKAGNDWIMPGNLDDIRDIEESVGKTITLAELQNCAKHILTTIMKSSRYDNSKPYAEGLELKPFFVVK